MPTKQLTEISYILLIFRNIVLLTTFVECSNHSKYLWKRPQYIYHYVMSTNAAWQATKHARELLVNHALLRTVRDVRQYIFFRLRISFIMGYIYY